MQSNNRVRHALTAASALILSIVVAADASAALIIDDYNDTYVVPPPAGTIPHKLYGNLTTTGLSTVSPPGATILGGNRDYSISALTNPMTPPNADFVNGASVHALLGTLNLTTDPAYGATWNVMYDANGSLNTSLAAYNKFTLRARADGNSPLNGIITIYDGTNTATANFIVPEELPGVFSLVDVPFSSFTPGTPGSIDFTSIDSILLTINDSGNPVSEADAQIDFFIADVVPEPATVVIWASIAVFAIFGVALRGRKK